MELFDNLPVACVVNGLYLTMHGGISEQLQKVSTINKLDRFREIDEEGLLKKLLLGQKSLTRRNDDLDFSPSL